MFAGLQEEQEQHSQGGTKTHTGVQAASQTEAKYETALCQRYQAKNKEDQANLCEARYQSKLYLQYQAENEEDKAK